MHAKALIVLEGDKKSHNEDDSSDNDKDYKVTEANRRKNALVPSNRIHDLKSKKDYTYH